MKKDNSIDIIATVEPYLKDLEGKAPSYGSIGIDIIFHDGRITKVEKRMSVIMKPEHLEGLAI
jgi:hypothetical protein